MIELDIKPYCQDCPRFRPEMETLCADGKPYMRYIVCENKFVCDNVEAYLRNKIVKEQTNENQ